MKHGPDKLFPWSNITVSALALFILIFACKKIEPERRLKVGSSTVTDTTATSANIESTIIDQGQGVITQYGHCWSSVKTEPIIDEDQYTNIDNKIEEGKFTSSITNLVPSTTYHVRAYALNNKGEKEYGEGVTFKTLPPMVSVSTSAVSNITKFSATSGGHINAGPEVTIFHRGICWSTSQNPTISNDTTVNGSGTGSFISNLTELNPGTEYYVKAYATSNNGTAYGNQISFTTDPPDLPNVVSNSISSITCFSAIGGGNVTNNGGATITAKGVCFDTNENPTIDNDTTIDGSGLGSFISNLTGLSPGITYYVRAYAINSAGPAYGEQSNFTTPSATIPNVSTAIPTNITFNSAICGGNVTHDGCETVTAKGVCWSTTQNPTINNDTTINGNGIGAFVSEITELSPHTEYFIRAYAINNLGVAYGEQHSFATSNETGLLIDNRDGKVYQTVKIGDQWWMGENLNVGTYVESIYTGTEHSDVSDYPIIEKYCYDNLIANCDSFGGLYDWDEMMGYVIIESTQGICPDGWHIPSDAEWINLELELGMTPNEADNLESWRGTDQGTQLLWGGTSGFNALCGGYRDKTGKFDKILLWGLFGTSTSSDSTYAYDRFLMFGCPQIRRGNTSYKKGGVSVRCVKDLK